MSFNGYKPPTISSGLQPFVDAQKKSHPMSWGYNEFVWLVDQGMNLTGLAKAMNKKTTAPIKAWLEQLHQERGY